MNNPIANLIEKKTCTKCRQEKSVGEFYKCNRTKDGFGCQCKTCQEKSIKESRLKNRERLFQERLKYQLENPIVEKPCTCCKIVKSIEEFYKNKNNKDGLSNWCKSCSSQSVGKNSENLLQKHKQYQQKNPIVEKPCTCCKIVKSIEEFYKNKNNKDGLYHWCKSCTCKNRERLFQECLKYQLENPIVEKPCTCCKIVKSIEEFYKNKNNKDGFNGQCKICCSLYNKKRYLQNPEKVKEKSKQWCSKNPETDKETHKRWRRNNPEKCKENSQRWRRNNPEKCKENNQRWRRNNPEKFKKGVIKTRKKIRSTFMGKLNDRMSSGIRQSLKGNKKGKHWETLVKYTLEELKVSLKSKFTPYMNWENIGNWDIDHDFCKSRLIFDSAEDPTFLYLWSLDNLQPLWHSDNLLKGDMTPWEWKEFKKKYPERLFNPEKFYKLPTTE